MPLGSKYAPLTAYLRAQPPETERVTLTFAEVEAIIGSPLPRGASTTGRSWWSNARTVPYARIWRSAGWMVVALWRGPGGPLNYTVTFTRRAPETSA